MKLTKHIPNFLTSLNLLSGSIAVVFAFEGLYHIAAILVGIASVFDFLDGLSARLFKAYSDIGKELDSLADLISFGFVPSVVLFRLLQAAPGIPDWSIVNINILPFFAFLIAVFSAIRLAKFNIDTRQTDSFIGLPTPANAIFIMSIPFAVFYGSENSFLYPVFSNAISSHFVLLGIIILTSFLLVSSIPLFSLKFKNLTFNDNQTRIIFMGVNLVLLIVFTWYAISLIIIFYILLSLAEYYGNKVKKK